VKNPKCSPGSIWAINLIPFTGKPKKCSGKPYGLFVAEAFILLDASKVDLVSYSTMRSSSADGERFQSLSEASHYHTTGYTRGTFEEGN